MFHRNALLDSQGSKILIQASQNYKNGKLKNYTEVRFANSDKPRKTLKGNFKCHAQIEQSWCPNNSPQ